MNNVTQSMAIYVVLDNRQADHQALIIKMKVRSLTQLVSILIDPRSNLSYISPKVVKDWTMQKKGHNKSWMVQLATGAMKKVTKLVESCHLELNGMATTVNLNILPLDSYDIVIGMDKLAIHRTKVDCYNKLLECLDDEGEGSTVQGKKKTISIKQISALQSNKCSRKWCTLFLIQLNNVAEDNEIELENHRILQ